MPRPKYSLDKLERMRKCIIDTTFTLLEEVGPEKISIRMITKRIGVSHMVFYTYFNNRDALMQALIEKQQERMNKYFTGIMNRAEKEEIHIILRDALHFYLKRAKLRAKGFHLMWLTPIKKPEIFSQQKSLFQKNIQRLGNLIQIGIDRGEFVQRDTFLAAVTILSIVTAPLILYHLRRISDKQICDDVIEEAINVAMQYLSCKSV